MNARELEQVQRDLGQQRRAALEGGLAVGLASLAAIVVQPLSTRLSVAVAIGAGVGFARAVAAIRTRLDQIERLALDPSADAIAEVARFGHRCVDDRERLAAWLDEIRDERTLPGTVYLTDRVDRYATELDALARDLGAIATVEVHPSAMLTGWGIPPRWIRTKMRSRSVLPGLEADVWLVRGQVLDADTAATIGGLLVGSLFESWLRTAGAGAGSLKKRGVGLPCPVSGVSRPRIASRIGGERSPAYHQPPSLRLHERSPADPERCAG